MNKVLKRGLMIILLPLIAVVILIKIYLFSNEAPIIQGKVVTGIEYKSDRKLDVYLPTNEIYPTSPVLVFFHGGAWVIGTKGMLNNSRFHGSINKLREEGYAIVAPDYTLARENLPPFPHAIIDAIDALQWIEDSAEFFHFDLKNVGLLGESAGAHIAMMTAFAEHSLFSESSSEIDLTYVIDVYGPTDLKALYKSDMVDSLTAFVATLPDPLQKKLDMPQLLFGFDPESDLEKADNYLELFSPVTYVSNSLPPLLIIHGSNDKIVPVEQTYILSSALKNIGIDPNALIIDGMDHAFRGASEEQKDLVQKLIFEFVVENYRMN